MALGNAFYVRFYSGGESLRLLGNQLGRSALTALYRTVEFEWRVGAPALHRMPVVNPNAERCRRRPFLPVQSFCRAHFFVTEDTEESQRSQRNAFLRDLWIGLSVLCVSSVGFVWSRLRRLQRDRRWSAF